MSNKMLGLNAAEIRDAISNVSFVRPRIVDTQGRPVIGANGAGIRKTVCPTCGKPLGANGAGVRDAHILPAGGVRIPSDSLTPRRLVGTNGAGIRKI